MNWRKAVQQDERGEAGTVRSWDGGTGPLPIRPPRIVWFEM